MNIPKGLWKVINGRMNIWARLQMPTKRDTKKISKKLFLFLPLYFLLVALSVWMWSVYMRNFWIDRRFDGKMQKKKPHASQKYVRVSLLNAHANQLTIKHFIFVFHFPPGKYNPLPKKNLIFTFFLAFTTTSIWEEKKWF